MEDICINRKEIPIGSVVYFLQNYKIYAGMKYINYGIVEEHYTSTICVRMIEPKDTRKINGVPIKELETPTKWKKLPKGWSYDTKLFTVEQDSMALFNEQDPNEILKAYKNGILVDVRENDPCNIESVVDKSFGWRLERRYDAKPHIEFLSINFREVYTTYESAKNEVDKIHAELERQASLSDYEWSVEKIDGELNRWADTCKISDDKKDRYRKFLLEQKNVEDIEVRFFNGDIQWKYWKNKNWMNILSD